MTKKARVMFLVGALVSFFIGYMIAFCGESRLTIDEYQLCEQTAINIYEQKEDALINIPNGIFAQISDNEIIVKKNNRFGMVKGSIEGEFLSLERNKQLAQSIIFYIASGMFIVIVFVIFCATGLGRKE